MMKFEDLIADMKGVELIGKRDLAIADIAFHTSRVVRGGCFVAIGGSSTHGHHHIATAVERGAVAIVSERKVDGSLPVTTLLVPDARKALALMSARFFGEPSRNLSLIGITGTNGKTTVSFLLEALAIAAGKKAGVIGTIEHRIGLRREAATHTTPESYDVQRLLRSMVDEGVSLCAMEVSSHALEQQRVLGCHFDGAIFTNLTPEHLDYHGDMETYFLAKAKLFRDQLAVSQKENRFAVINVDDQSGKRLAEEKLSRVWSYSLTQTAEVYCHVLSSTPEGLAFTVQTPLGAIVIRSHLLGRHNASNLLAAISAGLALGFSPHIIREGLLHMTRVPGRFEAVENNRGILAFVDYAHTPDALERTLQEARAMTKGKVIVVFGCGGDRDRAKRPLMGRIAGRRADIVFVADDNPRSENPHEIIDQILPGLKPEMKLLTGERGYEVIGDRRLAIAAAVSHAREGDVVVVAGKGHEDYQIIGATRCHFDDREELAQCLAAGPSLQTRTQCR